MLKVKPLAVMPFVFWVGAQKIMLITGWLPIHGIPTGVIMVSLRLSAETIIVALKAKFQLAFRLKQETPMLRNCNKTSVHQGIAFQLYCLWLAFKKSTFLW